MTSETIPDEFVEAPAFFWSIVLLDLGVVVPATVAAGVTALRAAPVALSATCAVVGWFALVPPSAAVLLAATSGVTTVAAVRMFRRLLQDLRPRVLLASRGSRRSGTKDPAGRDRGL